LDPIVQPGDFPAAFLSHEHVLEACPQQGLRLMV